MMKSLKTYTKIFTQDLQSENVLKSSGIKEVISSGSLKIERVVDQLNENNIYTGLKPSCSTPLKSDPLKGELSVDCNVKGINNYHDKK